jgi:hypothetical protein
MFEIDALARCLPRYRAFYHPASSYQRLFAESLWRADNIDEANRRDCGSDRSKTTSSKGQNRHFVCISNQL